MWVDDKSSRGFSALHFAAYHGNVEMIELLINLGADIFIKNNIGQNVLHVAA